VRSNRWRLEKLFYGLGGGENIVGKYAVGKLLGRQKKKKRSSTRNRSCGHQEPLGGNWGGGNLQGCTRVPLGGGGGLTCVGGKKQYFRKRKKKNGVVAIFSLGGS